MNSPQTGQSFYEPSFHCRWLSYEQVDDAADYFGRGLRGLNLEPGSKACIFADTRNEWFLSAQACFKQNFPLVRS